MPFIQNNGMVKGLLIHIVPNKRIVKGLSINFLFSESIGLVKGMSIPIGQTHMFRLLAPISYRPNNTFPEKVYRYLLFYQCSDKQVQKVIGHTVVLVDH